jgi:hypothetical protein
MNNINMVDAVAQVNKQMEKENYIANMLVRTLYSNQVSNSECYRIIELFKKKVLGEGY